MYRVLLPVDTHDSRARAQVEALLELPVATGDLTVDILHVHEGETTTDPQWAAGEGFAESFAEEMAETVRNTDRLPSAVETAVDLLEGSGLRVHCSRTGWRASRGNPRIRSRTGQQHDQSSASLGGRRSARCCSAASPKR